MEKELSKKHFIKIYLAAVSVFLGFLIFNFIVYINLKNSYFNVKKCQSQLTSVVERQKSVIKRFDGRPGNTFKDAELAGAENRVRVEQRRYDEAVRVYNTESSGFPGKIIAMFFDFPGRMPFSNEIDMTR